MAKQITTTVTILGKDQLSPVVARAAGKSITHLETLNKRASALSVGAFGVARATAGIGTAIAAPIIYAGKQAVDFEHQLAGLGKVAQMDLGSKGLTALGEQAKEVAPYLATMPADILRSMTALKQSGLKAGELKDVAKFVGEAGVAYNITADQAGQAFGTIRAAMGITVKETKSAFDVINTLSNQMNATPERLISFFTAGGAGVANALKLESNQIAAYGATLITAGKSGEEAATLMERVAKNIFAKDVLNKAYKKGGRGAAGLLNVLQTGANLKTDDQKEKYFKNFGEFALEVRRLAEGMHGPNGLGQAMDFVSTKQKYAGAVNAEFTSQMKSTLNQIKREWVALQVTVIDFGTQALPVIKGLVADVKPLIKNVGEWVKANPELTKTLIKGAAGLAVFSFGISALSTVIGAGATLVKAYTVALGWFSTGGALAGVTTGLGTLTAGMWAAVAPALVIAAPYLAGAAAIAVIGYHASKAYEKFEGFHRMVISTTTALQTFAAKSGELFIAWTQGDYGKMWDIGKAGVKQYRVNVDDHMKEFNKNKPIMPDGAPLEKMRLREIEEKRSRTGPQFYQDAEYNRRIEKEAKLRKLLNPDNQPGKPYYQPNPDITKRRDTGYAPAVKPFNWSDPFAPTQIKGADGKVNEVPVMGAPRERPVPVPNYNGGTSISLTNNPVFNIQGGNVTPEAKKEWSIMLDQNRYQIQEMLKDAQRQMERPKF